MVGPETGTLRYVLLASHASRFSLIINIAAQIGLLRGPPFCGKSVLANLLSNSYAKEGFKTLQFNWRRVPFGDVPSMGDATFYHQFAASTGVTWKEVVRENRSDPLVLVLDDAQLSFQATGQSNDNDPFASVYASMREVAEESARHPNLRILSVATMDPTRASSAAFSTLGDGFGCATTQLPRRPPAPPSFRPALCA